jgi:hypothetical protein
MGENSISLPSWWGYSPPPRQQPEHDSENQKTNNHQHAPPDPLCSIKINLREISPA